MKKIDLGNTCYLEFKNDFLIVHRISKNDLKVYYIVEIYELPNLNLIMRSNALGININETNDYYIINELNEDNNGEIILYLPFCVNKFEIKDNLAIFRKENTNYLYNLLNKEELINTEYDVTIINNDTIIINNEIRKIYDLKKRKEEKIEEESDKPKVKFLSRFRKKKKM